MSGNDPRRPADITGKGVASGMSGAGDSGYSGDSVGAPVSGVSSGAGVSTGAADSPVSTVSIGAPVSPIASPIRDFTCLVDPAGQHIRNMSLAEAEEHVASGDPSRVRAIEGSFALAVKRGKQVWLARSLGRPLRYFMAKQEAGPLLVVAERIDQIHDYLRTLGLHEQFRPAYTRMVPAHYVMRLDVVGCPDPNPRLERFYTPSPDPLPADIDAIGAAYIGAMAEQLRRWVQTLPDEEPIGVLLSGGIDSGSVFLTLEHVLRATGRSPARLKAFTLDVEGGSDAVQAREFLAPFGLDFHLETIRASADEVDVRETVRVIEDYKQRDVEAASMVLLLCRKLRERYPEWRWLVDGDGGDENLRAYPIEENPELTIRSVLGNHLLYHEGWGVDKIKHSLTYSGGLSRGAVRCHAPLTRYGFSGFSPYTMPDVVDVAERIPFVELTDWSHEKLYALKGQVVAAGVRHLTGREMPVFAKKRMQEGSVSSEAFDRVFAGGEPEWRRYFASLYG